VQAQRSAAWADVARRIAHEIKNPLTPITLSTERLRKKFAPQITDDQEGYLRYIDTISRHVRDIGKMVEEFVNFARMPTAILKPEALTQLIRKAVFSEQTAHPEISYQLNFAEEPITLMCDERLLSQALLNLLKNAAESFESLPENHPKTIAISTAETADAITITLHDSGPGFPVDKLAQLTEPYVTTRLKGTGLGLAIVKKTMEEHRGELLLKNHENGGALVVLRFAKTASPRED
jgi:two-component system, NtrC family, nitrogen regulation sensor histidine kinase NtrY